MKILNWLINRFGEASTYRGLAALGMALGIKLDPAQWDSIMALGLSVIGLINVFKKDALSPDVK